MEYITNTSLIASGLFFLGAAVFFWGAVYLYKKFSKLSQYGKIKNWRILFGLIIFFLVSYLALSYFVMFSPFNWFELLISIFFLIGSVFVYVVVTISTDTLQELESSKTRFEALVENGSDCVIIISPEAKPIYVSRSVTKILGYSPEDVLKLDMMTLIHPDEAEGAQMAIVNAMQKPGVPVQGHTSRVRHKDGSWRWLEAVVTNMLHDPSINGIVDNFRDVTDRIQAEEELRITTQRLVLATRASKLGIWDQDIAKDKLIWDESMFRIYGIKKESFKENHAAWMELIHPEDKPAFQENTEKVMRGEGNLDIEFRILQPDNSIRYVRAMAILECDKDGTPLRLVGTNLDITNRKDYELTLEQISFDIAHVIRRPLSNLLGLSSMIENDNIDLKSLKKYAKFIRIVSDELDDFTKKLSTIYDDKKKAFKSQK
ncbi:PAS domain-containing protein [Reichenbachiella sp. MALMAid0571]|uniref:PAS domain-containing protein n=1 Tax=Reichenbachiella sp. MALMAid0571 TaxID=3143939 RepID=UPI0032DF7944